MVSHHHEGLQVFTMGHLMPKSAQGDGNGNWSFTCDAIDTCHFIGVRCKLNADIRVVWARCCLHLVGLGG